MSSIRVLGTMTAPLSPDPWLTCPKPNPRARLRLFCFPYAGGSSLIFRLWSAELPLDIEMQAVQLPGRERRLGEPLFTRLASLVHTLGYVLLPYLDRPFAFFGHSMGALISFELAHEFHRRHGSGPVHLFASGRSAPQSADCVPPIHHLPESEFIAALRRFNGTPDEVLHNAELMQLLLPTLRADFAICETYSYVAREPLDCPISVFGGLQDDGVSRDDLDAWRAQTRSSFLLRMLPGDHFFLHGNRALLLQAITHDLTQFLAA
jgi:medium-chain acyl-[acyl-carrier-protein] hydrolase